MYYKTKKGSRPAQREATEPSTKDHDQLTTTVPATSIEDRIVGGLVFVLLGFLLQEVLELGQVLDDQVGVLGGLLDEGVTQLEVAHHHLRLDLALGGHFRSLAGVGDPVVRHFLGNLPDFLDDSGDRVVLVLVVVRLLDFAALGGRSRGRFGFGGTCRHADAELRVGLPKWGLTFRRRRLFGRASLHLDGLDSVGLRLSLSLRVVLLEGLSAIAQGVPGPIAASALRSAFDHPADTVPVVAVGPNAWGVPLEGFGADTAGLASVIALQDDHFLLRFKVIFFQALQ